MEEFDPKDTNEVVEDPKEGDKETMNHHLIEDVPLDN